MRHTKPGWGLLIVIFMSLHPLSGQTQHLPLFELLATDGGMQNMRMATPGVPVLQPFSPRTEAYILGVRPYNLSELSMWNIGVRWKGIRNTPVMFDVHYFSFERWQNIQVYSGLSKKITPVLQASILLSYRSSGVPGEQYRHNANASVFLGLSVSDKLYLTSDIINLWPSNDGGHSAVPTVLSLRAYCWIIRGLGWVTGVSLDNNGRFELLAGLGITKNTTSFCFITHPNTGNYTLGLEQQIFLKYHIRMSMEVHPALGFSTTGGVLWRPDIRPQEH